MTTLKNSVSKTTARERGKRSVKKTTTTNGCGALTGTAHVLTDLFFRIGSARGLADLPQMFMEAYAVDKTLALKMAFWVRDVRGGAGERDTFRRILQTLEKRDPEVLVRVLPFVPEYGRWDDLLIFETLDIRAAAYQIIATALRGGNALCAKWMPRKGPIAVELRKHMGLAPKAYRQLLVGLTKVVETQMCARDWDSIVFDHVPSVAARRYQHAFATNAAERYTDYRNRLVKAAKTGDTTLAKVNAGAIFPHDVISGIRRGGKGDSTVAEAQWEALPNYMQDNTRVLALADVSGSMTWGLSSVVPMDVSIALAIYTATKQQGAFRNMFMTFERKPRFVLFDETDSLHEKVQKTEQAPWGGNTDLTAALNLLLSTAISGGVSSDEMPTTLLILSDMQFDEACGSKCDVTALSALRTRFREAGYEVPQVVFWNLNSERNAPATFNTQGVALVSGFSPAILTSVLGGDSDPYEIMLNTIANERYAPIEVD